MNQKAIKVTQIDKVVESVHLLHVILMIMNVKIKIIKIYIYLSSFIAKPGLEHYISQYPTIESENTDRCS